MKFPQTFWLFGGDLRCHWLARQLAEEQQEVHCFALDSLLLPPESENFHLHHSLDFTKIPWEVPPIVILPLPLENKNGDLTAPYHPTALPLAEIFATLSPQQLVFGGQVKEKARALAKYQGITLLDYFQREELTIANAVPTAEGCIQILMERLPVTIQDSRVMVLGYGKVATATAQRLAALGAKVTIAARSFPQLEQARSDGFHTDKITQLLGGLCCYDAIVNTVPAPILGKQELEDCHQDCLLVDLASLPGGIDFQSAEDLHRQAIHALSLPGKVAPATASAGILRSIYHMLEEQKEEQKEEST